MAFTAKSFIIDITDGYLSSSEECGIRALEFWNDGSLISITSGDITATATQYDSALTLPENVFITSLSKTGGYENNSWLSNTTSVTLRIICVFDSAITFDKILFNNFHVSGNATTVGVQNLKLYTTMDTVTSTTYGNGVSGYDLIFDDTVAQHSASDVADDIELTLLEGTPTADNIITGVPVLDTPVIDSNFGAANAIVTNDPVLSEPIAATMDITGTNPVLDTPIASITTAPVPRVIKSSIIDIADNYGDLISMGIRSVDFYLNEVKITLTYFDITGYATSYDSSNFIPSNVFETAKLKTGAADNFSWKADDETTNQRLVCNFDSAITFDAIKVNNFHSSGGDTDKGAQNVKVYTSSYDVTNTVYDDITEDYLLIYDGTFDQHSEADEEDSQELILIPPPLDIRTLSPEVSSINGYYLVGVADIVTEIPVLGTPIIVFLTGMDSIISGVPELDSPTSPANIVTSLDIKIPLAFTMSDGNSFDMNLPSFDFTGSGSIGAVSTINTSLPVLTFNAFTGSLFTASLPKIEFSNTISNEILINILGQLPSLQCLIKSSFIANGDFQLNFKALQMSTDIISGNAVDILGNLPKFNFQSNLFIGTISDFNLMFPTLTLEVSSIITGENELNFILPEFLLSLDGDKLLCTILSYEKGKVR